MKILSHYKPDLVVNTDGDRYQIEDPFFDAERGLVVATDGHQLVAVPVEVEEGDKSRYLRADLLRLVRENGGDYSPSLTVAADDTVTPPGIRWPADQERKFPNWPEVVPPRDEKAEGMVRIAFNAEYLRTIANALGGCMQVVLAFDPAKPTDPILVRSGRKGRDGREIALLMPVKLECCD